MNTLQLSPAGRVFCIASFSGQDACLQGADFGTNLMLKNGKFT